MPALNKEAPKKSVMDQILAGEILLNEPSVQAKEISTPDTEEPTPPENEGSFFGDLGNLVQRIGPETVGGILKSYGAAKSTLGAFDRWVSDNYGTASWTEDGEQINVTRDNNDIADQRVAEGTQTVRDVNAAQRQIEKELPYETYAGQTAGGIATSMAYMGPGLALGALTGNPALTVAALGMRTGMDTTGESLAEGGTDVDALKMGATSGAAEAVFEIAPTAALFNIFKKAGKGNLANKVAKYFLLEEVTEVPTTLVQNSAEMIYGKDPDGAAKSAEYALEYINPLVQIGAKKATDFEVDGKTYNAQRDFWDTVIQTAGQTALLGGAGVTRRKFFETPEDKRLRQDYDALDKEKKKEVDAYNERLSAREELGRLFNRRFGDRVEEPGAVTDLRAPQTEEADRMLNYFDRIDAGEELTGEEKTDLENLVRVQLGPEGEALLQGIYGEGVFGRPTQEVAPEEPTAPALGLPAPRRGDTTMGTMTSNEVIPLEYAPQAGDVVASVNSDLQAGQEVPVAGQEATEQPSAVDELMNNPFVKRVQEAKDRLNTLQGVARLAYDQDLGYKGFKRLLDDNKIDHPYRDENGKRDYTTLQADLKDAGFSNMRELYDGFTGQYDTAEEQAKAEKKAAEQEAKDAEKAAKEAMAEPAPTQESPAQAESGTQKSTEVAETPAEKPVEQKKGPRKLSVKQAKKAGELETKPLSPVSSPTEKKQEKASPASQPNLVGRVKDNAPFKTEKQAKLRAKDVGGTPVKVDGGWMVTTTRSQEVQNATQKGQVEQGGQQQRQKTDEGRKAAEASRGNRPQQGRQKQETKKRQAAKRALKRNAKFYQSRNLNRQAFINDMRDADQEIVQEVADEVFGKEQVIEEPGAPVETTQNKKGPQKKAAKPEQEPKKKIAKKGNTLSESEKNTVRKKVQRMFVEGKKQYGFTAEEAIDDGVSFKEGPERDFAVAVAREIDDKGRIPNESKLSVAPEGETTQPQQKKYRSNRKQRVLLNRLVQHLRQEFGYEGEVKIGETIDAVMPDETIADSLRTMFKNLYGTETVFVTGISNFTRYGIEGVHFDGNVVYINMDLVGSMPELTGRTLGHEVMHTLRRQNPLLYRAFVKAMLPNLKNMRAFKRFNDKYRGRTFDENNVERLDNVIEEVMADFLADNVLDGEFWREVGQWAPDKKKHANRFAKVLDNMLERISNFLNTKLGRRTFGETALNDVIGEVDQARSILAEFMGRAAQVGPEPALEVDMGQEATTQTTVDEEQFADLEQEDEEDTGRPAPYNPAKFSIITPDMVDKINIGEFYETRVPKEVREANAGSNLEAATDVTRRVFESSPLQEEARDTLRQRVAKDPQYDAPRQKRIAAYYIESERKEAEAVALEDWAKDNGLWLDDQQTEDMLKEFKDQQAIAEQDGRTLKGAEHIVFIDPDGKTVTKMGTGGLNQSWQEYFTRLAAHNYLFPETKVELIGFGKFKMPWSQTDRFMAVTRQVAVRRTEEYDYAPDITELDDFMKDRGFVPWAFLTEDAQETIADATGHYLDYYHPDLEILIGDLHGGNAFKLYEANPDPNEPDPIGVIDSYIVSDPLMRLPKGKYSVIDPDMLDQMIEEGYWFEDEFDPVNRVDGYPVELPQTPLVEGDVNRVLFADPDTVDIGEYYAEPLPESVTEASKGSSIQRARLFFEGLFQNEEYDLEESGRDALRSAYNRKGQQTPQRIRAAAKAALEDEIKQVEEENFESFAKANGLWLSDEESNQIFEDTLNNPPPEDSYEHEVALYREEGVVKKVATGRLNKSWADYFRRLELYNYAFPELQIKLLGFGFFGRDVKPVIQQRLVHVSPDRTPSRALVDVTMQDYGFIPVKMLPEPMLDELVEVVGAWAEYYHPEIHIALADVAGNKGNAKLLENGELYRDENGNEPVAVIDPLIYDDPLMVRGQNSQPKYSIVTPEAAKDAYERMGFSVDDTGEIRRPEGTPIGNVNSLTVGQKWRTMVMSRVVEPIDRFVDGMGKLPDRIKYVQLRHMTLGSLDRLEEYSRQLYDKLKVAKKDEAEALYEYMTTKDADVNALPEDFREVAKATKENIINIGRALRDRGYLGQAALDKHEGQYLPRVYLKHLLGLDSDAPVTTSGGAGRNIKGDAFKYRKDIPKHIRDFVLGEIKDPAYLASRTHLHSARDIILHDMFLEIAKNPNWVLPETVIDYSHEENPFKRFGKVSYRRNEDGTYDLRIKRTKTVEHMQKGLTPTQIQANFEAGTARTILNAEGRPVIAKRKNTFKMTGWLKSGQVQWRKNKDGTYDVKAKQRNSIDIEQDSVPENMLSQYVGGKMAQNIADGKGRVSGGRIMTPLSMLVEADRLEKMAKSMAADKAETTRAYAAKMRSDAQDVIERLNDMGFYLQSANMPKDWAMVPDSPRYGAIRGMVVRKEIYDDIVGNVTFTIGHRNLIDRLFMEGGYLERVHSIWKWTKTAANLQAHFRNFFSNGMLIQLSGVPMHKIPGLYVKAIREIYHATQQDNGKEAYDSTKRAHWDVAKDYGLGKSSFSAVELKRIEIEMLDMLAREQDKNSFLSWHRFMWGIGKVMNATGDMYQLSEAIGKTVIVMNQMERGASPEQATRQAHRWLFDYSLASPWLKKTRRNIIGSPFLTFSAKVLPRMLEVALTAPWRFAPYLILHGSIISSFMMVNDVDDDDDLEAMKKALTENLRDRDYAYFWPYKDEQGRWRLVDLGYLFPWTAWTNVPKGMYQTATGNYEQGLANMLSPAPIGGPIPDAIVAITTGVDPFTKQQIIPEEATLPQEKAGHILKYIWNFSVPPFISSHGPLVRSWSAINKYGETVGGNTLYGDPEVTTDQALLKWVGLNTYAVRPELSRYNNVLIMNSEIQRIKRRLEKRVVDPDADTQKELQAMRNKLLKLVAERNEYIRASDFPEKLRTIK